MALTIMGGVRNEIRRVEVATARIEGEVVRKRMELSRRRNRETIAIWSLVLFDAMILYLIIYQFHIVTSDIQFRITLKLRHTMFELWIRQFI